MTILWEGSQASELPVKGYPIWMFIVRQPHLGGHLSVRSIQKLIAMYREQAGLDVRATPHTLRHTNASQLVAAGVPTVHVQKILGHRQLSSTQVYCTVSKEELARSASALE